MNKKSDSIISLISLILAVVSIVNFQKALLIIQLLIGVLILIYSIIKLKEKENKIPQLVFSIVTIINSIMWILFVYGIYEKMVS